MKIGYARVSTKDQNLKAQIGRLREAGCERVFTDVASGKKSSRPGWDDCLSHLRDGDVLIAVKLDRFGRSVQHLAKLADDLKARGADIACLDQPIDTTTAAGKLFYDILAAFAEFERSLIVERTRDGLAAARLRPGFRAGRKPKLSVEQADTLKRMREAGFGVDELAATFGIHRTRVYAYLRAG